MSPRPGIRDPVQPPNPAYTRQRFIKEVDVEWAEECSRIMVEHGLVRSVNVYERRTTARNRARKLIRYFVELRMHEKWQLVEHTEPRPGGWVWSVEYRAGRSDDHGRPERDSEAPDR